MFSEGTTEGRPLHRMLAIAVLAGVACNVIACLAAEMSSRTVQASSGTGALAASSAAAMPALAGADSLSTAIMLARPPR